MKTLFKLFIVAVFSIISLNIYSQGNSGRHEYGIGTVKNIDNNHIQIMSIYDPRQAFVSEKPHGADIQFDDGTVVSYKVIILPNDRIIFKEIKKVN